MRDQHPNRAEHLIEMRLALGAGISLAEAKRRLADLRERAALEAIAGYRPSPKPMPVAPDEGPQKPHYWWDDM